MVANGRIARWGLGLVVGFVAACSPASPIAPDPGPVNIPGFPSNGNDLPGSLASPTPRPTRSPVVTPSLIPTPWPTPLDTPWPLATPTPSASVPDGPGKSEFLATLADKGVTLNDADITSIRAALLAKATGTWDSKGDLDPDATLKDDYNRYRTRFASPYTDIKAYRTGAMDFASGKVGNYYIDVQFYQRYQQPLVAKWDSASRRFVVITSDGAVSTYTAVASLAPARYILVPSDL